MCFDRKSSLLAWSLAYSISIFLYLRNRRYDRWNALFIICFTTIQLLEAGIWDSFDEPKSYSDHGRMINSLLTCVVLLVLLSQPLIQTLGALQYGDKRKSWRWLLKPAALIFFLILMYGVYRVATSKPGQFHTEIGKGGHLIWEDSSKPNAFLGPVGWVYMIGLFFGLLFMDWKASIPLVLIGLTTLFYSIKMAQPGEMGSYWCFTSVLYALIAVMV